MASWSEKAAADVEAKDAELKALIADRDADLERLKELQARFDRDVAAQAAKEVTRVCCCTALFGGCVETRAKCRQAEELRKIELARQKAIEDEKKRQAATLLQRVLGTAFKVMLETAAAKKGAGKKKGGKKKK